MHEAEHPWPDAGEDGQTMDPSGAREAEMEPEERYPTAGLQTAPKASAAQRETQSLGARPKERPAARRSRPSNTEAPRATHAAAAARYAADAALRVLEDPAFHFGGSRTAQRVEEALQDAAAYYMDAAVCKEAQARIERRTAAVASAARDGAATPTGEREEVSDSELLEA